MKSSYKPISELVERIDIRNSDGDAAILMGLSIDKCFIHSVANTVGTDLTKYKVICKNQFAVSLMQVSRDSKIPVACFREYDRAIMSPAYSIFQVADESVVLPDYLDMWFKRPEFDREAAFVAVGGVRGSMPWEEFARIKVHVPTLERQRKIVDAYKAVNERIHIKQQLNDNLAETANALFCKMFFSTSIAEKCDTGTFSQLIKETVGGDWGQEQPKGNYTSKVTCIRGTDIPALNLGSISAAPTRYILPKNLSSKRITADNIVVEISGGSPVQATGRVALIPDAVLAHHKEELICSNFCRVMNVRSEYLYFFFQYWTYLYRNGVMFNYENSSTGLKNFNFAAFVSEEKIQIPPIDIAKRFNAMLEPIYKEIFSVGFEIEKLGAARELLLPHLMLHDFSSR